jgi:hypothetical protein
MQIAYLALLAAGLGTVFLLTVLFEPSEIEAQSFIYNATLFRESDGLMIATPAGQVNSISAGVTLCIDFITDDPLIDSNIVKLKDSGGTVTSAGWGYSGIVGQSAREAAYQDEHGPTRYQISTCNMVFNSPSAGDYTIDVLYMEGYTEAGPNTLEEVQAFSNSDPSVTSVVTIAYTVT